MPGCLGPWCAAAVTTLAFWRDSAAQLELASPALAPAAIWAIRWAVHPPAGRRRIVRTCVQLPSLPASASRLLFAFTLAAAG
jgi:hypothetical protein